MEHISFFLGGEEDEFRQTVSCGRNFGCDWSSMLPVSHSGGGFKMLSHSAYDQYFSWRVAGTGLCCRHGFCHFTAARALWHGYIVLGGLAAYPIAAFVMGKEAALFAYVLPFFVSTAGGATIAILFLAALKRTKAFDTVQRVVANKGRKC